MIPRVSSLLLAAVATATAADYHVSPQGIDTAGRGSASAPWKTLAFAVRQIEPARNHTLRIAAGSYRETKAVRIPPGVNLIGAGEKLVTITATGQLPCPAGTNPAAPEWKLNPEGSLIQLVSPGFKEDPNRLSGPFSAMIPCELGNQTLAGFTLDGHDRAVKAGIWVQNRHNVTLHDVTIRDCAQRGAVFTRNQMPWFAALPDHLWMRGTKVFNCRFRHNGGQLADETLGNLCLSALDGADLRNLDIADDTGYGIKFIMVGHFRNLHVRNCKIRLSENDPQWGERIAIELWNLDRGNVIRDIDCNTWHSYVNHGQIAEYQPARGTVNNLVLRNLRIVDLDGVSAKEAIEIGLSGVTMERCLIQDKGFGLAIWNPSGRFPKSDYLVRRNVFVNARRDPTFGFGNSAAIFAPDPLRRLRVHHNVFDKMGNALDLPGLADGAVHNNVFLNTRRADLVAGPGVMFSHNFKQADETGEGKFVISGGARRGPALYVGDPGFAPSDDPVTRYHPGSRRSPLVDRGIPLDEPYSGTAPDIGVREMPPE